MKFEIYPDKAAKYRWRLKARNGQIVATSHQAFARKSNAKKAARKLRAHGRSQEYPSFQIGETLMRHSLFAGIFAIALVAATGSGAFAFGDNENTNHNTNTANGGAGGDGGHGGAGGDGGQGGSAYQGQGQGQDQDQAQGQIQGQAQGQSADNDNSISIDGDETETTVTTVTTPSVNPTVVCAQAVNVGVGVLGAGGSAGFSYTDEDCNDREWARIGLESQDPEIQAIAKDLLTRALKSRMSDRYPNPLPEETVEIGSSVVTVSGRTVPDWCYNKDGFGMNARDKRICGID